MIYFDNAATSWPKPECVYEAVDHFLRHVPGNFGRGQHGGSMSLEYSLYEARAVMRKLIGARKTSEIIFTFNATDSLNMALFGLIRAGQVVVTTSMEHNAVTRPLMALKQKGVQVRIVPANLEGQLDWPSFKEALRGASFVVMAHASNVTGQIRQLGEYLSLAKSAGAVTIVDAAQTAGSVPIQVQDQAIDVLVCSGHKGLLGPQGTGLLYLREGLRIEPFRLGGTGSQSEQDEQPDFFPERLESGTLNGPGLAGLKAGAEYILETGISKIASRETYLRQMLIESLQALPGIRMYGLAGSEHTAVLSFNFYDKLGKVIDSTEVAYYLSENFQIACRAGLHCAPWTHRTLGTIQSGTVRISPGYFTTDQELTAVIESIKMVNKKFYEL